MSLIDFIESFSYNCNVIKVELKKIVMKKIEIEDCEFNNVRSAIVAIDVEIFYDSQATIQTPVYLEDANTGERTAMESIELIDGKIIIKHQ